MVEKTDDVVCDQRAHTYPTEVAGATQEEEEEHSQLPQVDGPKCY